MAADRFAQVMSTFPTALRINNIRLPVELIYTGTIDNEIKAALTGSIRFEVVQTSPFKVMVDRVSEGVELCLQGTKRFGCKTYTPAATDQTLAEVIDAFVRQVFAPPIELSQSDMSTLDGRAVQGDAQSVINDLLDPQGGTQ